MTRMANCHPDRPHLAKGLCRACYKKANYHKYGGSKPQKEYYKRNRERVLERQRKYREENRDWINEKMRAGILRWQYGLSEDAYNAKIAEQRSLCPICQKIPQQRRNRKRLFVVDHNHATNKVRSLLCDPCNLAIGHLNEDLERIDRLKEYLISWKAKHESEG